MREKEREGEQEGERRRKKRRRKKRRKRARHTEKLCKHVDIEDMKVRRAQNNFKYKIP